MVKNVHDFATFRALDLNEYNHITATYFLLAERKLKSQRAELARRLRLRQHAHAHKQPQGGVAGVQRQHQAQQQRWAQQKVPSEAISREQSGHFPFMAAGHAKYVAVAAKAIAEMS